MLGMFFEDSGVQPSFLSFFFVSQILNLVRLLNHTIVVRINQLTANERVVVEKEYVIVIARSSQKTNNKSFFGQMFV